MASAMAGYKFHGVFRPVRPGTTTPPTLVDPFRGVARLDDTRAFPIVAAACADLQRQFPTLVVRETELMVVAPGAEDSPPHIHVPLDESLRQRGTRHRSHGFVLLIALDPFEFVLYSGSDHLVEAKCAPLTAKELSTAAPRAVSMQASSVAVVGYTTAIAYPASSTVKRVLRTYFDDVDATRVPGVTYLATEPSAARALAPAPQPTSDTEYFEIPGTMAAAPRTCRAHGNVEVVYLPATDQYAANTYKKVDGSPQAPAKLYIYSKHIAPYKCAICGEQVVTIPKSQRANA